MNVLLYSEYLDRTEWIKTNCTVSSEELLPGPYTSQYLYKTNFDQSSNLLQSVSLTGTSYEASVFLKTGTFNFFKLEITDGTNSKSVVVSSDGTSTSLSNFELVEIEYHSNDFFRITVRATFTAGTYSFKLYPVSDLSGSQIPSSLSNVIVYGPCIIKNGNRHSYQPSSSNTLIRALKSGNLSDPTVWSNGLAPSRGDIICSGKYKVTIDSNFVGTLDASKTDFVSAGGTSYSQSSNGGFLVLQNTNYIVVGPVIGSNQSYGSTVGSVTVTHPTRFTLYGDMFITMDFSPSTYSYVMAIPVSGSSPDLKTYVYIRNAYSLFSGSGSYYTELIHIHNNSSSMNNDVDVTVRSFLTDQSDYNNYGYLISAEISNSSLTNKSSLTINFLGYTYSCAYASQILGNYGYNCTMNFHKKDFMIPSKTATSIYNPIYQSSGSLKMNFLSGIYVNTDFSKSYYYQDYIFPLYSAVINGDIELYGRVFCSKLYLYGDTVINGSVKLTRTSAMASSPSSGYGVFSIGNIANNISISGSITYQEIGSLSPITTSSNSGSEYSSVFMYSSQSSSVPGTLTVGGSITQSGAGIPMVQLLYSTTHNFVVNGDVDFSGVVTSNTTATNRYASLFVDYVPSSPSRSSIVVKGDVKLSPTSFYYPMIYTCISNSATSAFNIEGTLYGNSGQSFFEESSAGSTTTITPVVNRIVINSKGTSQVYAPIIKSQKLVWNIGSILNNNDTLTYIGIEAMFRLTGGSTGNPTLKIAKTPSSYVVLSETVENALEEKDVRYGVTFNQSKVGKLRVPLPATVLKDINTDDTLGTLEVGGSGGAAQDYTARFNSIDEVLQDIINRENAILSIVEDI